MAGHATRWSLVRATKNAMCSSVTTLCGPSQPISRPGTTTWRRCGCANRRGRPGPRGERWRLSLQSVRGVVIDYARAVGVTATPHAFRHLKASTLLNRGASLSEVQDVLGHADPGITKQIYAHYTPQLLRAAVEKYSATPAELAAALEAERERRREG